MGLSGCHLNRDVMSYKVNHSNIFCPCCKELVGDSMPDKTYAGDLLYHTACAALVGVDEDEGDNGDYYTGASERHE